MTAAPAAAPPPATDPRTVEILDRIKAAFAAKGFDGASMQDLARAAGMSAGNFYRYFPSKNAIIAALVHRDMAEIEEMFARILQSPDPRAALLQSARMRLEMVDATEGALWAEIEAAATRRPEVAALHERLESTLADHLARVFAHLSGRSPDEARRRYGAQAQIMICLVHGVAVRSAAPGHGRAEGGPDAVRDLALRLIDGLLAEVAADAAQTICSASSSSPRSAAE